MYLTKREKDIEQAQKDGEMAFSQRSSMPDYGGQKHLEEAWKAGYNLAAEDDKLYWSGAYHVSR